MKRKSWLIISLFTVLFVFNCLNLSYDVKAISNVNYTFEENLFYESDNIELDDSFNLQNESIATEFYNATYSFNITEGEIPDDWYKFHVASVINNLDGHDKVLQLGNITATNKIYNYFPEIIGIMEFWFRTNDVSERTQIDLINVVEDVNVITLRIHENELKYYNGAVLTATGYSLSNNVWYHVKLLWWEYVADDYRFDYWLNGKLYGDNEHFTNDFEPSGVRLSSYSVLSFFDAIGYSWNHYNEYENVSPIFNITSNIVVAKDEFAYDSNGEFYDIGVRDACGWEGSHIDYTYLVQDTEQSYDKKYKIYCTTPLIYQSIRKYYNDINDGVYNFTLKFNYLLMLDTGSSYWWTIYSTLTNITAKIQLFVSAPAQVALKYLDDIESETYTLIGYIDLIEANIRELTLFIGDLCYLTYKDEIDYYKVIFPKLTPEEKGLREVKFSGELDVAENDNIIHLDNIGVFVNGTNLNNDFGSSSLDLNTATWYSKTYNLIDINAFGIFSFGVYSSTDSASLKGFYNYTNTKTWNVYNYFNPMNNPSLSIISNQSFTINQIKIYGVKMKDETKNFIPDFYYGSINIDESYFYVDSSNRLQFNLIADDNNTEWIELRFDILFQTTENRSIQFKSNIDGISVGYVHLAYWGWATTNIYFPTYTATTTSYLPQGFVIFTISIIISDQDITWYDDCNGYITNLKLLHTPGGVGPVGIIYFDISTMILILIPLIIILAPTLVLSVKLGKKIILPMFIFMSLLCAITNLIPIWLFFVIAIACGSLIFVTEKRGVN